MPVQETGTTAHAVIAATLVGAGTGLAWWAAYDPRPLPWAVLVAVHLAVALAAAAAAARWRRQWFNAASLGVALVMGLGVAPATLAPLYRKGLVWGPAALAGEFAIAAGAALLGAHLGRKLTAGPRRLAAAVVLAASLLMPLLPPLLLAPEDANDGALGLAAASPFPTAPVAIIGLDGADWRIVQPLLDAGRLPTLADLIRRGQHGVLRSLEPAFSPVAWTSIFTGQPSAVHGLTTWDAADARNRRSAALWDILGASGASTLTVNVPGTWPPLPPPGGVMVAGFPMPGINPVVANPATGLVLSTETESGRVPTVRLERLSDVRFRATLFVDVPLWDPWIGAFSNVFLDVARQKLPFMSRPAVRLESELRDGLPVVSGDGVDTPVVVPREGFGPWLTVRDRGLTALMRPHLLEAAPGQLRLYLTPPRPPLWDTSLPLSRHLPPGVYDPSNPYVTEQVGIGLSADARVGHLLPEISLAAESARNALVRRAIDRLRPTALAFVITVTDRMQHSYLRFHEPGESPAPLPLPARLAGRDPIAETYEHVDTLLAALVERLPADALLMVVSDHGFDRPSIARSARHRLEGIWIAAGPMVPAVEMPEELSILDILPSVLHCLGAQPAEDLPGRTVFNLCPGVSSRPPVATYTSPRNLRPATQTIDRSREEQIRSLGYVQ